MPQFEHAQSAIQGARNYQEDHAIAQSINPGRPTSQLLVVLADGMGGHAGGAVASELACEAFARRFREYDVTTGETISVRERLSDALEKANIAIAAKAHEDPTLCGMGSTLIGAELNDEGLQWVSVGDSPLLLVRDGEVAQINADHSLAPELDHLAAIGEITKEQALENSRRNMLRSAVTGDEIELIDLSRWPLRLSQDDYIIFASDGLQTIDNTEVGRVVSAYAKDGPEAVASALLRAVEAVREPFQDNTTIIAVRVVEI